MILDVEVFVTVSIASFANVSFVKAHGLWPEPQIVSSEIVMALNGGKTRNKSSDHECVQLRIIYMFK